MNAVVAAESGESFAGLSVKRLNSFRQRVELSSLLLRRNDASHRDQEVLGAVPSHKPRGGSLRRIEETSGNSVARIDSSGAHPGIEVFIEVRLTHPFRGFVDDGVEA